MRSQRFPGIFGLFLAGAAALLLSDLWPGPRLEGSSSPGVWTPAEWKAARRFSPLPPPPRDTTNGLWGNTQAARLGHRLFFDSKLSPRGFSCASCHKPELGMTDGLPVANTIAPLHRNTMTILNVAYYRWLTWDGARDSVWHQAVGPVESPKEMGSSRLFVVRSVMRRYREELRKIVKLPEGWEKIWPALPPEGKPGEAVYDNLPEAQKNAVNRVFTSILKVIAAYEAKVVSKASPFDRFVAGDARALSPEAQKGFQHFLRFSCDFCHSTPLFSDDEFHNIALPPIPERDLGRWGGLRVLKTRPFRGTGPYADGEPVVYPEDYQIGKSLKGAFRTPSLREVAQTGPYGHNGAFRTLEEVLDHYVKVTKRQPSDYVGQLDASLPLIQMSEKEKRELVAFLRSLSSDWQSEWTKPPKDMPRVK